MSNDNYSPEITEAVSRLLTKHPFFAHLMLSVCSLKEVDRIPGAPPSAPAATDGKHIWVVGPAMRQLDIDHRVFIIAHEIGHVMMRHLVRFKAYERKGFGPDGKKWNHMKANAAADYIINALLSEADIGEMPPFGLIDKAVTGDDLFDDVYCRIPEPPQPQSPSGGGGGNGDEPGQMDHHMDAADDTPSEEKMAQALAAAAQTAKAKGSLPGALERLVDSILNPKVPWKQVLREFLVQTVGRDERTWRRPNKRKLAVAPHVYLPGYQGNRVGTLAVVVDTSGSISSTELQAFMTEVAGILEETTPEHLAVFWTDAKVAGIDEVEEPHDLLTLTPKGGGGTDMEAAWPAVRGWAPDGEVDAVVVLTDGWTDTTEAPEFPVLWVTTDKEAFSYGEVIKLEVNDG